MKKIAIKMAPPSRRPAPALEEEGEEEAPQEEEEEKLAAEVLDDEEEEEEGVEREAQSPTSVMDELEGEEVGGQGICLIPPRRMQDVPLRRSPEPRARRVKSRGVHADSLHAFKEYTPSHIQGKRFHELFTLTRTEVICTHCGELGHRYHQCQQWKTKACFAERTGCRYGDRCRNAHKQDKLRKYIPELCTEVLFSRHPTQRDLTTAVVLGCQSRHHGINDCPFTVCLECGESHLNLSCLEQKKKKKRRKSPSYHPNSPVYHPTEEQDERESQARELVVSSLRR